MDARDLSGMKVLLVQTSFLGDVVLSTPLIAALKGLYPHAQLWFLGTKLACEIVRGDPLLAGTIAFDKNGAEAGLRGLLNKAREIRQHNFHIVYSLQRSARTSILLKLSAIPERIGFAEAGFSFLYTDRRPRLKLEHEVERNLSLLGAAAKQVSSELRLFISENEPICPDVRRWTGAGQTYTVVVPGSAWHTKAWSAERYHETVVALMQRGQNVLVLGSPSERSICEQVSNGTGCVNLGGSTSIAEFVALIRAARLVVCNDSFALHVASAFKVPTVVAFCATSPKFGFGPWHNERARVIQLEGLACKPCRRHGGQVCPTGTEACMRNLEAVRAIAAAQDLGAL